MGGSVPNREAGDHRFRDGVDALRSMFIPDTFAPIRLTLAPTTISSIAIASERHTYKRVVHLPRSVQATLKLYSSNRAWQRVRVKR
jgi:hypothetical protein